MKHRKSLLLSIWGIAIGIVLWISGWIITGIGIIHHAGGFLTPAWDEFTATYYFGIGLLWAGIVVLILAAFGIVTTFIREHLDREQKTVESAPTSRKPS